MDTNYFIGEDAEISARFGNCSNIRYVKWIRETDSGNHAIDTTLLKYEGTIHDTAAQLHVLIIRNCNKSDVGTYFLEVFCSGRKICSNRIHLQVFKGNNFIVRELLEKLRTRGFTEKIMCTLKDDVCFIKWLSIEKKYPKSDNFDIFSKYTEVYNLHELDLRSTISYFHDAR